MNIKEKISKKFIVGVVASAITLTAGIIPQTTVSAEYTGLKYDDYLYYLKIDSDNDDVYDYVEITDCDETATEVVIPAEIDGLPVTSIGNWAFYDCTYLTSITIPDSVTSIGNGAFMNCCILEKITIPENVTFIGACAFVNCKGLTSITIPEGVKTIIDETFSGCENLTSITIPESVEKIGYSVFANCYSLESITIPENVMSIENGTFLGCINLTNINVSENNKVYSSDAGILLNKNKTELICVPAGRRKNEYPESITSIGGWAFGTCISLTSITLPEDVTSIGYKAFAWCENLTSITIENPNCEIFDSNDTISNSYDDEVGKYIYSGVIRGYKDSTAQAYAEKFGYNFESLGEYTPSWSVADIIALQNYLVKKTDSIGKNYDLNNDGNLNVFDLIILKRKVIYG